MWGIIGRKANEQKKNKIIGFADEAREIAGKVIAAAGEARIVAKTAGNTALVLAAADEAKKMAENAQRLADKVQNIANEFCVRKKGWETDRLLDAAIRAHNGVKHCLEKVNSLAEQIAKGENKLKQEKKTEKVISDKFLSDYQKKIDEIDSDDYVQNTSSINMTCGSCEYSEVGSSPWNWHCNYHRKTISSTDSCNSWYGTPSNYSYWECDSCEKSGNNEADRCAMTSPSGRAYFLCHRCFFNMSS